MSMSAQRERIARWEKLEEILRATQAPQPVHWKPKPGPQTDGYNCLADILFFGGAAGTWEDAAIVRVGWDSGAQVDYFQAYLSSITRY
jgi:hypothetical protein